MAKKKIVKKVSKGLKDFDIVAHTISVEPQELQCKGYESYKVHAIYINKYGLEVGYLVWNTNSLQYYSWDRYILEEYFEAKKIEKEI